MKLLTKAITAKLIKNYEATTANPDNDPKPALKVFNPCGAATWLFTELDGDLLFGLCDLGMGFPELGYASLTELAGVKGPLGIGLERDMYFEADKTLSEYADEARNTGSINA